MSVPGLKGSVVGIIRMTTPRLGMKVGGLKWELLANI